MASSFIDAHDPTHGQAGYATVAALGVSLAVALLAGALVLRGVGALKLARADYRRAQAEYALSGQHLLAATKVLNSSGAGRLAWSATGLDGLDVTVLAEPEGPKLSLAAAAALEDKPLVLLGAVDPHQARGRLARLDPASAAPDQVEAADTSAGWRACAASVISPWGGADVMRLGPVQAPNREPGGARAGQIWRIRATTSDGWTDERIVRLVGQAETPNAVIWRRFGHGSGKGVACDKIIGS